MNRYKEYLSTLTPLNRFLSLGLFYLGNLCYKLHLPLAYQWLMVKSQKIDKNHKVWKKSAR